MAKTSLSRYITRRRGFAYTTRDSVVDSIFSAYEAMEKESEVGMKGFIDDLVDVLGNTFDEDFENYSKESLKISMMMRGYDDDETFRYVNLIKDKCVEQRIGVIDIKKPVELGNLAIALLEV